MSRSTVMFVVLAAILAVASVPAMGQDEVTFSAPGERMEGPVSDADGPVQSGQGSPVAGGAHPNGYVSQPPVQVVQAPASQTQQTAADAQRVAQLVLSGHVTVTAKGQVVQRAGVSSQAVNRKIGMTKEYARDVAEAARCDARQHADVVAGEAIRKSAVSINSALTKAYRYTDGLRPAIGGAASRGTVGIVVAVIALLASVVALLRRPRNVIVEPDY